MGSVTVRSLSLIAFFVVVGAVASVAVGSDQAAKRNLVLHGPQGARLVVEEMPLDRAAAVPRAARDVSNRDYLIRSGTCARPGKGVAFHVSPWGGQIDVPFDSLLKTTFAIEARKPGALKPALCVEHHGRRDLTFATNRPRLDARAKRLPSGALRVRSGEPPFWDINLTLTPLRGGAATQFGIWTADAGGSGGAVAHLRRGTCFSRPSSDEITLGRGAAVAVAIPFASFGRGRWVFEVLTDLFGQHNAWCAQL